MQNSWKEARQIAFTYIGTVVGAGFASGKELLTFFVQYGTQGLIGVLLATVLFAWAGTQVMLFAHRTNARSFQDFSLFLFGRTFGTLFNILLFIVLLGTTSVMLAGTGALFIESFGFHSQAGIWLSILLVFIVSYRGLDAIHAVNSLFVPLLIAFTCLVFFYVQPWAGHGGPGVIVEVVKPFAWITSPLYYVAMNIALTQAVLVPIGQECKSEKSLLFGGVMGGLGIGLLLLLGYWSLRTHQTSVHDAEMPMIALLSGLGRIIPMFFSLLVYCEIFSTLSANVFGLARQMMQQMATNRLGSVLFILGISYVVSFVGFGSLLGFLYPLFGQLVLVFLVMLGFRQLQARFTTSPRKT
ncbi:UNVERIFIED_CONTAM: putative membrane protein YkvI [Brevibacillus sp. OAP136]